VPADKKGRYAPLETYAVPDRRGRQVAVRPVPQPPVQSALGTHLRREGQRIDHLSQKYLGDPTSYWRICELNGAMYAEMMSMAREVEIPRKSK
jgi:hypothetical protein